MAKKIILILVVLLVIAASACYGEVKNAVEEIILKDQLQKLSYGIGLSVGMNLKNQGIAIDPAIVMKGISDGLSGAKPLLTEEELKEVFANMQKDLAAKRAKLAEENKKEGEAFLADNKSKPGVKTLPSGLQYLQLAAGNGPSPTKDDTVVVNYRGTLINGTEFDSSYKYDQPIKIKLSQVIPGWTEALQLMKVGSKWKIFIPASLAYGERGAGAQIGPNSTLIFEVELLSIEKAEPTSNTTETDGKK